MIQWKVLKLTSGELNICKNFLNVRKFYELFILKNILFKVDSNINFLKLKQ